jgi:hypothetical protein
MVRLNAPSHLSLADSVLFGLANATLLFTVIYYITGLHEPFRLGFAVEDGPVEWGTAICLFLSSLVLFRNAAVLWGRRGVTAALLTGFYGLLYLLVLPLAYTRLAPVRRGADALAIPVPDTRHMRMTVAATLVILSVQMMTKWEPYEFTFSLMALSIFLNPRNASQVT